MPLTKLQFKPGINREITAYSNEGGWVDCDKIRFRMGFPEKIGGWEKYSASTYQGTARRLHNWTALDNADYMGVGTHLKYYIEEGGSFSDITPIRSSTTNSTTFAATNTSTTITVTEVNHGASAGDFVTFSSAASLGGVITAAILNAEHQIVTVTNASTYTITSSVAANGSDTGTGGGATDAVYQINTGLDSQIGGTGWGSGIWGGTTTGALRTQLAEALDNSETGINVDDETGITTDNDVIFIEKTPSSVSTTLNEALDASETTITVASASGLATGDTIVVEGEFIKIGGVSSNDLTSCTRGHLSSTAATHPDKTIVHLVDGSELMTVTATTDDNTLTVARGASGTVASTHADDTEVRLATGNANSAHDFVGWGQAGAISTETEIRTWSHDNFGEDLFINPRDSSVYYWDKTNGLTTRAVELSTISDATNVPSVAKQILVSDIDRHVIAFGTNTYGTSTQDPLMIRWSNQESAINWTISANTTAGSLRLGSGSTFVQAVETKREILIWTDTSLHTMRYIGGNFIFGIQQIASNITIAGPKAAIATEDFVFWMGIDNFYVYAGGTQPLPCTVKDKVFLDFNKSQIDKVYAAVNSEFSEVIWFYPSETNSLANDGTGENDRYVIYNYLEKVWYYGSILRTAWLDRGTRRYPVAAAGGYLYNHEIGYDDDTSAMTSYIESAPMDIGDGDRFSLVQKVVPDLTFDGSLTASTPAATFTLKARNSPGQAYSNTDSGTTTRTSTSPVEVYTDQLNLRARGRSFALRVDSSASSMKWKLGSPRIDVRPDGRR